METRELSTCGWLWYASVCIEMLGAIFEYSVMASILLTWERSHATKKMLL